MLSPNVSLMPDAQFLIDPANALDEDAVWVLGLRAVLSLLTEASMAAFLVAVARAASVALGR